MQVREALTFDDVTDLITDEEPPRDIQEALGTADVTLHLAGRRHRSAN